VPVERTCVMNSQARRVRRMLWHETGTGQLFESARKAPPCFAVRSRQTLDLRRYIVSVSPGAMTFTLTGESPRASIIS
jgi:hypothetical protein